MFGRRRGSPQSRLHRRHRRRLQTMLPTRWRGNGTWSFQSYNLLRKTSRGRRTAPVPSSTSIALFPEVRGESAPAMDFATSRWHRYSTVILGPRPPWGQAPEGFRKPGPRCPARRAWHDRSMSMVGMGRRRLEGGEKVTGTTRFTADLDVAGLLHVQLVLSHLASARIRSIETGAARSAPGVFAVFTGADLALTGTAGPDQPLAAERVFYMGQPVAAVIAVSEAAAVDAAALIEVDLEALPASIDAESAMQEGTAAVLDAREEGSEEDAAIHGAATKSESEPLRRPPNVSAVASLKRGHVAPAMAGADVVIRETYRLAGVHHSPMEPHVSIARPEPDGGMTIWAPTQGPFQVRDEISKLLDVPAQKVRVVPMPVGGGFGGKVSLLETLLALLARRTGRPLRLTLTRQQEFAVAHPAPAAIFDIELGAKRNGTLVALRARYHFDNGASSGWHAGITGSFLGGTYRIPNFELTGYEVATNKTPVDAYRAPGAPQAYFALESAMDELAIKLGMDPIELRLLNASKEGDLAARGNRGRESPCSKSWKRRGGIRFARRPPGQARASGSRSGRGAARALRQRRDAASSRMGRSLC